MGKGKMRKKKVKKCISNNILTDVAGIFFLCYLFFIIKWNVLYYFPILFVQI